MTPTYRRITVYGTRALRVSVPVRAHEVTRYGKDGPYQHTVWDKRVFIVRADASRVEINREIGHVYSANGRGRDDEPDRSNLD